MIGDMSCRGGPGGRSARNIGPTLALKVLLLRRGVKGGFFPAGTVPYRCHGFDNRSSSSEPCQNTQTLTPCVHVMLDGC